MPRIHEFLRMIRKNSCIRGIGIDEGGFIEERYYFSLKK